MQQYRVNYTLLIGLAVGTLITSGAVYGLWKFQIERKSGVLLSEAEKAHAAGDNRNAARYYSHYLSIHGNEPDTRVKLAETYADLMQQEDAAIEEKGIGLRVLEQTVREMPDAIGVQRRLVEFYGDPQVRRYQDALDHLSYMLEREPDDAELQGLRASYLVASGNVNDAEKYSYKLIGYDPKTDKFDVKNAKAPHDIDVYTSLANILRGKLDKPELADRIMEQLIEVNPESAKAYLSRGTYHLTWNEDEASGEEDIQKAYQLAPEDESVLLVMANQAVKKKEYDQATEFLEKGKKLHPQDPSFYQAAAEVRAQQQQYEEALAEIDAGLTAIGKQKGSLLLISKADLQYRNHDLKGLKETIAEMKQSDFRSEFVEWYEARTMVAEEKWFDASEALYRLRSKVVDMGDLLTQVDVHLGLCYERQGALELAERAYTEAAQRNPKFEPAVLGMKRVKLMRGLKTDPNDMDPVQKELAAWLEKPKEERDMKKIKELMKKYAGEQKLDDVQSIMMQVNLAVMNEDFAEARKLLGQADQLKKNDLQIHRALIQVARFDPKVGPAKAMNVWNAVAKKFDDGPALRSDKADIIIAINNDQMKADLAELLTGIDHWDDDQKVALWASMAGKYLNLGMVEEAQRYLTLVADHRPNELPTRLSLFTLALETNDDEGMQEAQKKILEIVKDTDDSRYLFTEGRRQLSLLRRGQLEADSIPAIRQLIDRAIKQRPDWHELYLLSGDLELTANNGPLALEQFNKAEELGRPNPRAVATHIRLLSLFGQFNQAAQLLDRIPEQSRLALLGTLYTEILFRTNKVNDAIKEARVSVEADPENAQKQQWHGQLLARSAAMPDLKPDERKEATAQAIAALRKAVELEPELPDSWFALITLNAQQNDLDAAQQALRDSQLALSGDNLQLFLAKSYEALRRWFDAETMYRTYYEGDPKDIRRAQQLAAFYISPVYPQPDRQAKLVPLLNQILKAAEETGPDGKKILAPNDPNLLWARRVGAELLAGTKDYQNLLKAEKLLASSSQNGLLSVEDRLQMAQILAPRPEPESRQKAIGLLEDVSSEQPLSEAAELALGQLYFASGDWNKAQTQMLKTIGRFQTSAAARESYIGMLLSRGDQRNNQQLGAQLNKLRELAPNSKSTISLTVQVGNKLGRQKEVLADLRSRLPNIPDPTKLTDEQADMLAFVASLYVTLGDLDGAEKIYRQLVQRNPVQVYALAMFLGTHDDVGKCFELLEQSYKPDKVQDLLTVGVNVLRQRRDDVGDKYDAQMEDWLARALRDNPDSISLQMLQADFYDVQKRYEDSSGIYSKLLDRKDLVGFRRAIVLNNLAFLVALAGSAGGTDVDAMKRVEEAENILGPNADILDTKAVVLIERKQYPEAIELLKLSLTDNPTSAKYFHLVVAYLGAGENRNALEAWDKAEAAGLTRDELNRLEHTRYDEVKAKIEQLRKGSSSVTQTERPRKAG